MEKRTTNAIEGMRGALFVVATPIGNLKDISERARETLAAADCVFAEDTRVARRLLSALALPGKRTERLDEHVEAEKAALVVALMKEGKRCVLVSDAGTPGIADPGARLIRAIRNAWGAAPIIPIPGPSALTTALSISGVAANRFAFLGYPPAKKGRKTFFETAARMEIRPLVFFESPHRIAKTLQELRTAFGEQQRIFIARELTKHFEEWLEGTADELLRRMSDNRKTRGEFVVIIPGQK